MKKLLPTIILCLLISFSLKAQDIMVLQNAEEIVVKVLLVDVNEVHYKRWNNIEGPTYVIDKSNLLYVKYQDGHKDLFYKESTPTPAPTPTHNSQTISYGNNKPTYRRNPVRFNGYSYAGAIFDKASGGPTIDVSAGINIFERVYVGAELGFCTNFEKYAYYDGWGTSSTTLFSGWLTFGCNLKLFLSSDKNIKPFINGSIGGWWGIAGELKDLADGFYGQVGLGMDCGDFSFSIGYSPLVITKVLDIPITNLTAHCGYVKLGVRFGK